MSWFGPQWRIVTFKERKKNEVSSNERSCERLGMTEVPNIPNRGKRPLAASESPEFSQKLWILSRERMLTRDVFGEISEVKHCGRQDSSAPLLRNQGITYELTSSDAVRVFGPIHRSSDCPFEHSVESFRHAERVPENDERRRKQSDIGGLIGRP